MYVNLGPSAATPQIHTHMGQMTEKCTIVQKAPPDTLEWCLRAQFLDDFVSEMIVGIGKYSAFRKCIVCMGRECCFFVNEGWSVNGGNFASLIKQRIAVFWSIWVLDTFEC